MSLTATIRILESDSNRCGDLFGRLMADLFVALGYDRPRLNIHKSGREVDLQADHRLERRKAVGECKATGARCGGDDLNKFAGVIDVEHDDDRPVIGYFISLSGFRETAIEQEKKRKRTEIVRLDASGVIDEMIKGRALVAFDRAADVAGRLCGEQAGLALEDEAELLAHQRGWIWAVYYARGKARTHFALVHADGTPLARAVANEVIAADRSVGGGLHALVCLNPAPPSEPDIGRRMELARTAYAKYLSDECGHILLDGMPADGDVGTRQMRLETLFVPLHLVVQTSDGSRPVRRSVGSVLTPARRLAVLAPPGGGKSTLLKRLAVAYATPDRRASADDDLPDQPWLPIFIRCRELRDLARGSFADLLDFLAEREGVRVHAAAFRALADQSLLDGRALLLVDGLDEISDPGDRAAFVGTLRAALQAHPRTTFVVTSREAGFRHVATHLAPVCDRLTLAPFDKEDIGRLCVAWHREVVGDTEKVRADAEALAASIIRNDRIRQLAVNPLLLTTLLLVRRWVGSLPTGRAALYAKAVELLLMTWNTEGHEPIPLDEALPQLCYVASAMMLEGVQKVSHPRLKELLLEARTALPTELGYVRGSVDEFIGRVEHRSSLLMMSGQDVEDGLLSDFYEFRHLTFQEFLTARAMVEGWHPGRQDEDSLAAVLEPHVEDERWREVIPLAAVLGRKETDGLLRRMTARLAAITWSGEETGVGQLLHRALSQSLADEAAAKPETIRAAICALVEKGRALTQDECSERLTTGKYGDLYREEARRAVLAPTPNLHDAPAALLEAVRWVAVAPEADKVGVVAGFRDGLSSSDRLTRIEAALGVMQLVFVDISSTMRASSSVQSVLSECGGQLAIMLTADPVVERYVATWALAWLGERQVWNPPAERNLHATLLRLWRESSDGEARRMAGWAFSAQPLLPREPMPAFADGSDLASWLTAERYESSRSIEERLALLTLGWYLRAPWSEADLAELLKQMIQTSRLSRQNYSVCRLAEQLGVDLNHLPAGSYVSR